MSRRHFTSLLALALAFGLSSCGTGVGDDGGTEAGSLIDGSIADGSTHDAGGVPVDGGMDGGADGGVGDGGPLDGGPPDAATLDAGREWPTGCLVCHGSGTSPAPPTDTAGNTDNTVRGVGAHRNHLEGDATWHREVVCEDCHTVPTSIISPGHTDTPLPAETTWGAVAAADGASPAFDGSTTTCSGVYCHGATLLSGGSLTTPNWTEIGTGQASCGTCHGLPPDPPHPADTNCSNCHPTLDARWSFVEPRRHIDGVVDLNPGMLSCTTCHGSGSQPAPPTDTSGNMDTTARGVGAHRSHLGPSVWHAEVTCDACHVVPGAVGDPGHTDSALPAELTWGTLARTDGASPSFDASTTTCAGVYCHGETLLAGGRNTTPDWTNVGAGEATCGTCHGLPPSAPHPAATDCASCHPTIAGDRSFPDPSRHIDGIVDLDTGALTCTSCHGSGMDPAPPTDTGGRTATTARGVGAHQSHLGSSAWRATIQCVDCHTVPGAIGDVGHIDTPLPAELTFGARARADRATPSFDGTTTTCSGVYCHGETLISGGLNTTPNWTSVGTGEADCGTCHSLPPAAPHPANTNCSLCHPTIAADRSFPNPERHIDGVVDLSALTCTSCHGSGTDPAPPLSTSGRTSTRTRGVGAHQSHLGASSWRAPISCTECHVVPATVSDVGHMDTALPAEITFGARANADRATPLYRAGTRTCSGVYCHGETLQPGGTSTVPTWTNVGSGEAACGTCHGLPPGGTHTTISTCETCHGAVVGPGMVITNPNLHIDGIVQSTAYHPPGWSAPTSHGTTANAGGLSTCQTCHGPALDGGTAGVSCNSCHPGWQTDCTFCHGGTLNATGAPPEGIDGETARTLLAVGAHTEHVSTTSMHLAWGCDQCHVTPTSALSAGHIDGDGRAEVTFGPLNPTATYNGATATCASLYCHGNGSSTVGTMVWTDDPILDCGSCHADFFSPTRTDLRAMSGQHDRHVRRRGYSCDTCHSANVDASGNILMLDRHVDGLVDVQVPSYDPLDCGGRGGCNPSCHGDECWN